MNQYVGKRLLLKLTVHSRVEEFKVLEISPSENWVKLMDMNGRKFWEAITTIAFVEELKDMKAGRPE